MADLGYDTDLSPGEEPEKKEDTQSFVPDGMVEGFAEECLRKGTATLIPGGVDVDFTPDSKEEEWGSVIVDLPCRTPPCHNLLLQVMHLGKMTDQVPTTVTCGLGEKMIPTLHRGGTSIFQAYLSLCKVIVMSPPELKGLFTKELHP